MAGALKMIGGLIAPALLKFGKETVADIIAGKNVGKSLEKHGKELVPELAKTLLGKDLGGKVGKVAEAGIEKALSGRDSKVENRLPQNASSRVFIGPQGMQTAKLLNDMLLKPFIDKGLPGLSFPSTTPSTKFNIPKMKEKIRNNIGNRERLQLQESFNKGRDKIIFEEDFSREDSGRVSGGQEIVRNIEHEAALISKNAKKLEEREKNIEKSRRPTNKSVPKLSSTRAVRSRRPRKNK